MGKWEGEKKNYEYRSIVRLKLQLAEVITNNKNKKITKKLKLFEREICFSGIVSSHN